MMWLAVVKRVGGIYGFGKLKLCIHDRGMFVAWDMVIKREWRVS